MSKELKVFAKRSGNLTASPEARKRAVEDVAALLDHVGRRGGVTLIPGGGDGGRGREMMATGMAPGLADTLGRLATIRNGLLLAGELAAGQVPHQLFLANPMRYADPNGIGEIATCTPEALRACHAAGAAAIVLGGSGENGYTTDAAVLAHAHGYQAAYPASSVCVLKSMEVDGVFMEDPRHYPEARRYARLSANVMARNPATSGALDPKSLELLQRPDGTVEHIQLYDGGVHSLVEAVTQPGIGTLVLRRPDIDELAA